MAYALSLSVKKGVLMRWYIDGYNVTKSDPATRGLSLEDQRAALEARCRIKAHALG